MYTLRSTLEPVPVGQGTEVGPSSSEPEEITASGATYDEALDALRAQVPTGWRLIGLIPDYDRVLAHLHGR